MPPVLLSPVSLALFALVLALGLGVLFVVAGARKRRRFEKRKARIMAAAGTGGGSKGRIKSEKAQSMRKRMVESTMKELEQKKKAKQSVGLRAKLRRAGLQNATPRQYYLVCGGMGLAGAMLALLGGLPPIALLPVAIVAGLGLPEVALKRMAVSRQKKFTGNFADAVDVIVRGIRSGLPVGECLNIISREFVDPVGGIFQQITEGQKLGMTLPELMERTLQSMPTSDFKFFAIVLTIQQQTGGNLADTLENLSRVLRARKKMADKVQALSSEAKSSAAIIGSLPFLVGGTLFLANPDYVSLLYTSDMGPFLLAGGGTWMLIGMLVMRQMINFEI